MSITAIIILIILGILLFIVEFLLVPGVTVAGIGGFVLMVTAIYFAYQTHGFATGSYVLLGTVVFSFSSIFYSLRTRTWKKVMLDSNIDGKSFTSADTKVKPGDKGICISRLNPIGKVMINEEMYEAKSKGEYIDTQTEIEVIKVIGYRVVVKPLK